MTRAVDIIVAPYDSGLRSVRMGRGPEALLAAGLVERLERRGATVRTNMVEVDTAPHGIPSEIASAFALQREVAQYVAAARARDAFPLVLSGNCSSAVGTVGGMMHTMPEPPLVCWFDAHADFNTPETTTSGFLDGMALAMLTGRCWQSMTRTIPFFRPVPEPQVVLIGARHEDAGERVLLDGARIHRVSAAELPAGLTEALSALPSRLGEAYVHVDLDVIDPSVGRANGWATPGGLTADALREAIRQVAARVTIGAAALTAYDPDYDAAGTIRALAGSVTADLA
jgi:arginase